MISDKVAMTVDESRARFVPRRRCQWSFETLDPDHPDPSRRDLLKCESCQSIFIRVAIGDRPCPNGCPSEKLKAIRFPLNAKLQPLVLTQVVPCSLDSGPYRDLTDEPLGISQGTLPLSLVHTKTIQIRNNSEQCLFDLHLELPAWVSARFVDPESIRTTCWLAMLPPEHTVDVQFRTHPLQPEWPIVYGRFHWTSATDPTNPERQVPASRSLAVVPDQRFAWSPMFAWTCVITSFIACFLLGSASITHVSLIAATWFTLLVMLTPGYFRQLSLGIARLLGSAGIHKDLDEFLILLEFDPFCWLLRMCTFLVTFFLVACTALLVKVLLPEFSPSASTAIGIATRLAVFVLGLIGLDVWMRDMGWSLLGALAALVRQRSQTTAIATDTAD